MPHHKSAAKRVRTNELSRRRNVAITSRLRSAVRAVRSARTRSEADAAYKAAVSVLDRTVSKGVIKRATADRQKSRLARFARTLPA
jgi:small subunit ribosomal protein S20